MSVSSTIEAFHVVALIVATWTLRRFLLAIAGDVSGLTASVAGVVGWVRGLLHCGQLRAKCPSPPQR